MEYARPDALVSTEWLAKRLDAPDIRIVDGSFFLPAQKRDPKAEFTNQHIPGAVFFDIDEIADTSSPLPHMMPSAEKFSSRVRKLGLGDGNKVIVYDTSPMTGACRVWWMFRAMGHKDVAVLDGGLPKWMAEGHPVTDDPTPPRVSPQTMRGVLGIFLVIFCIYFLARPNLGRAKQRPLVDGTVGILGGIIGALTGLAGIVINIWTTMQGLPKDEQRAVFQPSAVILFIITILWLGGSGIVPAGTGNLFLLGLPLVLIGTQIGYKLYGHLNEASFRHLVLVLLFGSGLTLIPSLFR